MAVAADAPAERSRRARWQHALALICAVGVYLALATWNIGLPGLYMDEVNPDYLVVKILNPAHAKLAAYVLPGNYILGGRAPVLVSLYHGTQTFWLGLPFYWLFGTGIGGVRLTHAMFGICVLAAFFALLRSARLPAAVTGVAAALLALDPAFTFAFRTQSYITLFGAAWVLASVAVSLRDRPRGPRQWGLAGLCAGLGVGAYFVHAFFLPALGAAVWTASARDVRPARSRGQWALGLVAGMSGYWIGLWLLMRSLGSIGKTADFLAGYAHTLGAFSGLGQSLAERAGHCWQMTLAVVTNAWHHAMMFGDLVPAPGSGVKVAMLIAAPLVLAAIAEVRGTASAAGRMSVTLPLSFAAVALVFGGRLGGHHYVVMLPFLYAALCVCGRDAGRALPARARKWFAAAAAAVVATLGGVSIAGQIAEARALEATGGAGLMSDAINRFAADLARMPRSPAMLFPDWGLTLPVEMLTRGSVEIVQVPTLEEARRLHCEGRDVGVALISDREARRNEWSAALGEAPARVTSYAQRDGKVVFDFVLYSGAPKEKSRRSDCRLSGGS